MEFKELRHIINMGLVRFQRMYGARPDTLILGKNEYNVSKEISEKNTDDWSIDKVWGMEVILDENSDDGVEMTRKVPDFFLHDENFLAPYGMKIDIVVPIKFKKDFKSFILKQSNGDIGVQVSITYYKDLMFKSFTRFHLSISGKTKELVTVFSNYLLEIGKILNYSFKEENFTVERLQLLNKHGKNKK